MAKKPPPLSEKQKKILTTSAFLVRAYILVAAMVTGAICVYIAEDKYDALVATGITTQEFPRSAAWANIFAIYMPLIGGALGYLFAEQNIAPAPLAPNGFANAVFRDLMAVVVMTVILWIPIMQYRRQGPIKDVVSFLTWYQSVALGLAGIAFYYYYRSALKPIVDRAQ